MTMLFNIEKKLTALMRSCISENCIWWIMN